MLKKLRLIFNYLHTFVFSKTFFFFNLNEKYLTNNVKFLLHKMSTYNAYINHKFCKNQWVVFFH